MTPDFDDSTTIVAATTPISTDVEGEAVILHPDTGLYHGLNGVGTDIWSRIQEPVTVAALAAAIAREHDASPERVRADVEAFLGDLLTADLIRVDGQPA